jgi:hypothetical protein
MRLDNPPTSPHDCNKLVLAGTLERPRVTGRNVLDQFERVSPMYFGEGDGCQCRSPDERYCQGTVGPHPIRSVSHKKNFFRA